MRNFKEKSFYQSIIKKIIAAVVIGGIAMFLSGEVIRVGFQEMLETVNKLSRPNYKLRVVNKLFHDITNLDQLQKVHALKNPDKPYADFKKGSGSLLQTIDTLRELSAGKIVQIHRLDSMETILHTRDKLFGDYLTLRKDFVRNKALSKRIKAASKYIANIKPQVDSSVITTNQKITTTTIVPTETDSIIIERKPKRSFLGRLFGIQKAEPLPTALKHVEQELKVQVDTLTTVANQDSSLLELEKMMRGIEREQHQRTTKLMQRELQLLNTENKLHNQLLVILHTIEAEELMLDKRNIWLATQVVNASYSRINVIIVGFIVIAAILTYLILIDISRSNKYRKQLINAKEEAEHLGQVKQRFLANMSHELRTPLQAIIGFAEQVRQQDKPDRAALKAIHQSSEHLLQIVNEVLDYSRIASGKFTFEQQPFDMWQLITEVIETMKLQADKKSLQLILKTNLTKSVYFTGDAFRLRQILYNLLGNAIKFTETGHVILAVRYTEEGETAHFNFEVKDTGIGIPAEEIDQIFGVFEQGNASILHTYGGAGLGLNIVKTLVENQGGSIDVNSKVGMGSIFNVRLPFVKAQEVQLPGNPDKVVSPENKFNDKVLVVDDDMFILQLCATILNKNGIANVCTTDAASVLKQEWDQSLKLVLLDIRMPEISGIDLCKALRARVSKETRIYALTAQALPEEREAILQQGFDGILNKPFREQEMLALIHKEAVPAPKQMPEVSVKPDVELDLSSLIKMTGGNEQQLQMILDRFVTDTRQDLQLLDKYLKEALPQETREIIHRLAGRTGQCGSKELFARLHMVELALHKGQPLEDLLEEITGLQEEIENFKNKIQTKITLLQKPEVI